MRQIAATKFCRSENDFHMSTRRFVTTTCCGDVSQRFVASCVSTFMLGCRATKSSLKGANLLLLLLFFFLVFFWCTFCTFLSARATSSIWWFEEFFFLIFNVVSKNNNDWRLQLDRNIKLFNDGNISHRWQMLSTKITRKNAPLK